MFSYALYFILVHFYTANGTILWPTETPPPLEDCEYCNTDQCVAEANYYLSNMDTTVDPCNDFYQFACGNFVKKNANLPSTVPVVNVISNVQAAVNREVSEQLREELKPDDLAAFKKVKTYYQSCMNTTRLEEDGIRPISELLDSLGGWPIALGSDWDESKFDLIGSLERLRKKNCPISFPFGLTVIPDIGDSSKSILSLDLPPLTFNPAFLAKDSPLPAAYLHFVKNASVLLGADEMKSYQEVVEIQTFESKIFEAAITLVDFPRTMTIKELSSNVSTIPWLVLFNLMLNPSGIRVDENEPIHVRNLIFFSRVAELVNETPKRILANYLGWSVVQNTMPYLPEKLTSLFAHFMNIQQGTSGTQPRELSCVENVKAKFSIGVSSMYVRRHFNKQIKSNVEDLFEAIKNQTRKNLEEVDWMDEETRQQALDKLEAMRGNIAYADELLDDQKVDEYYSALNVAPGSYLTSALNVSAFKFDQIYKSLRAERNKYSWKEVGSSVVVNAFYHFQSNLVEVSAGFLRGSLYEYNRPQYLNFGAMGTIIGHEITHAFDTTGRQFDKNGDFKNWWNPVTEQKYLEKTKCIVEQYSKFVVRDVELNVNGERTQGENIADNGGTKAAYHAYNEWASRNQSYTETCLPQLANYTPQQMFWISAAGNSCSRERREYLSHLIADDAHSPNAARVIVTFANIPEFARDFQCRAGSRMNPTDRCVVW